MVWRQINFCLRSALREIENKDYFSEVNIVLFLIHEFTSQVSKNNKRYKDDGFSRIIPVSGYTKPNRNIPMHEIKQKKRRVHDIDNHKRKYRVPKTAE